MIKLIIVAWESHYHEKEIRINHCALRMPLAQWWLKIDHRGKKILELIIVLWEHPQHNEDKINHHGMRISSHEQQIKNHCVMWIALAS